MLVCIYLINKKQVEEAQDAEESYCSHVGLQYEVSTN